MTAASTCVENPTADSCWQNDSMTRTRAQLGTKSKCKLAYLGPQPPHLSSSLTQTDETQTLEDLICGVFIATCGIEWILPIT